ncbi:hypothetical protein BCF46_1282 [Litoreibacter meonggei]|uniref:Type IV pilus biogenesis protein PilP n=1 Tax=Litoreibacter meonggei TaxID=1049199 RepID=A0A497WY89_9RHOB|nr:hypothetical protein [Litoreibacter meonggei]RLJ59138.1 hypothetical protein BCF46_1282 [Litoreibacter meonggei]
MTPNFALNLSEDGIVLLHRHSSGAGWAEVGEAPLNSDDLGAALAALRDKAEALEGPDFSTKLILPPSQLLYATIVVEEDVKADVEHALEERTPYTAAQLNYDICGEPPEVMVVAVARETLEEAESFLGPYGFNPVGFTALPDPSHFSGSPDLGPLPSVGGKVVSADDDPIKVLSPKEIAVLELPIVEPEEEIVETEAASDLDELPDEVMQDDDPEADEELTDVSASTLVLPTPPPAAFSSRRKPVLGPATSETGDLVTSRAPRIAIPTDELRKAPVSKKPPKVEPRIKTGEAAKQKAAPPIVPPPATKAADSKSEEPRTTKSTRLGQGVAALRAKARNAKDRKAKAEPAKPIAAQAIPIAKPDPIAELAARQAAGKPRFLGLILTGILIVVLLLFAALSSFLLPDNAVTRFFGGDTPESETVEPATAQATAPAIENNERLASLPLQPEGDIFTIPSEEEIAESETPEPEILLIPAMTQTDAETAYAVSGVWQMAPDLRTEISRQDLDDLYESSLDPDLAFEDAPALANFDATAQALEFQIPASPPSASILFSLDERGLVRPSPEGAENPDGILVFSGKPPIVPPQRPDGLAPNAASATEPAVAEIVTATNPLAGFKPTQRPSDLQEQFERATQGGRSIAELASIRPQVRPDSAQFKAREDAIARALAEADAGAQEAEARAAAEAAAQAELDKPTAQAVARSLRPGSRPRNFARVVARARQAPSEVRNPAAAASTAAISRGSGPAVARNSRASPTGTTRASVARAATDNNAISLGKVALVGVFGTSSNRRALVRMPNGRFKKVGIGDRVDGGRVAAIGEGQLKYTKGGRTVTLAMPKG